MRAYRFSALLALCVQLAIASDCGATPYTIRDLGAMGGSRAQACSINSAGTVAGTVSGLSKGAGQAFVCDPATGPREIGTLPDGYTSFALGMNDSECVVGYAHTQYGRPHAFVYNISDGLVDIDTSDGSWAHGINNSGQVAGYWEGTGGHSDQHAFLWDSETGLQNIGSCAPRNSYAYAINDNGLVAGTAFVWNNSHQEAVIWDSPVTMRYLELPAGYTYSAALAINASGIAAGYAQFQDPIYGWDLHAVYWDVQGRMYDLAAAQRGTVSSAYGIGAGGLVVGQSTSETGRKRPAVWGPDGLQLLDCLAGGEGEAMAINGSGVIAGWSLAGNGDIHAVVWEPIPEPSALLALLCALGGLPVAVAVRRRR